MEDGSLATSSAFHTTHERTQIARLGVEVVGQIRLSLSHKPSVSKRYLNSGTGLPHLHVPAAFADRDVIARKPPINPLQTLVVAAISLNTMTTHCCELLLDALKYCSSK
jgi:hypothetical protein